MLCVCNDALHKGHAVVHDQAVVLVYLYNCKSICIASCFRIISENESISRLVNFEFYTIRVTERNT